MAHEFPDLLRTGPFQHRKWRQTIRKRGKKTCRFPKPEIIKFILMFHTLNLILEGPCIIFCSIYTFQRDTQCSSTDCLLMHRCQLYMFRTITVHPQELLFRCCMCRLWYVVRNALSGTSRWCNIPHILSKISNKKQIIFQLCDKQQVQKSQHCTCFSFLKV